MKKYVLMFLVASLSLSCNGQTGESKKPKITEHYKKQEHMAPKGSWQVNKEFDENGNLTRFDSIYSWSSSGNVKSIDNDSIFSKMQSMMQKQFSMHQGPLRNGFMKNDSIMKQFFSDDFFNDNFFSNTIPLGMPHMDDIMKHMESMRQQFFNDHHRYIIPPMEDKEDTDNAKKMDRKQI